jgi:hypothetical protein
VNFLREFDTVELRRQVVIDHGEGITIQVYPGSIGVVVEHIGNDVYIVDFTPEDDFYSGKEINIKLTRVHRSLLRKVFEN